MGKPKQQVLSRFFSPKPKPAPSPASPAHPQTLRRASARLHRRLLLPSQARAGTSASPAAGRGCSSGPITHAVEAALADGIDVLSMSLGDDGGAGAGAGLHEDPVAAATFSAVARGVFVCAAAGNTGPTPGSVANDAPWVLTSA